jgi:hypothetical protein
VFDACSIAYAHGVSDAVDFLQSGVFTLLIIGGLILAVFALIDAVRVPEQAFPAAGKQTKNVWLIILGISIAVIFAFPILILKIAGVVAAAVYVIDVRPAVKQYRGRPGTSDGPYGPW